MQNEDSASGPDAPAQPSAALTDEAFAAALLHALAGMAARSTRRQADLTAALRGAGLPIEPARVRAALRLLRQQGCIENLGPLSDGGLLLSVTATALARFGAVPRWLPLGEDDAGG